jgi:hypothetical protein
MGDKMIKNIIIISLVAVLYLGLSWEEVLAYVYLGLDNLREIVYTVQNEVK